MRVLNPGNGLGDILTPRPSLSDWNQRSVVPDHHQEEEEAVDPSASNGMPIFDFDFATLSRSQKSH